MSENETTLDRIARRLADAATARTVYGDPVEREGLTVIPAARVRLGFGGGSDEKNGGSGGGGGLAADPVGWIEIADGGARWRPARDPVKIALVLGGVLLALYLRSARRRRWRKFRRRHSH